MNAHTALLDVRQMSEAVRLTVATGNTGRRASGECRRGRRPADRAARFHAFCHGAVWLRQQRRRRFGSRPAPCRGRLARSTRAARVEWDSARETSPPCGTVARNRRAPHARRTRGSEPGGGRDLWVRTHPTDRGSGRRDFGRRRSQQRTNRCRRRTEWCLARPGGNPCTR